MDGATVGTYVKVGRLVTAFCEAIQSSPASSPTTGEFIIRGLPYTCGSTTGGARGSVAIGYFEGLKANLYSMYGRVRNGDDYVVFSGMTASGGSVTYLDYATYCNKSGNIIVNMVVTYEV